MTPQHDDYQTESHATESNPGRRSLGGKIFDGVCLTLLIAAVGYLGWFGVAATRSVSRSLAGPETIVRLQIVNSTSDPTLAKIVAGILTQSVDHRMSFAVVDTAQFGSRKVHRSFLVSRGEDQTAARMVADRLGMKADRITVLPLEHNNRNVSVTLVLGDDYRTLSLSSAIGKETDRKT